MFCSFDLNGGHVCVKVVNFTRLSGKVRTTGATGPAVMHWDQGTRSRRPRTVASSTLILCGRSPLALHEDESGGHNTSQRTVNPVKSEIFFSLVHSRKFSAGPDKR